MRALEDLKIATPCSARWEDMKGDDRVRHCGLCDLNVYNVANMTRAEAMELVTERSGQRVCMRMFRRSDGTVLTQDCPVGITMRLRRSMFAATAWFLALFGVSYVLSYEHLRRFVGRPGWHVVLGAWQ